MKAKDPYVEFLMDEWQMQRASRSIQACMRNMLSAYPSGALMMLRREPRLQIEIEIPRRVPEPVWAYFPVHRGQVGDEHLNEQLPWMIAAGSVRRPKRKTEILLVVGQSLKKGESMTDCEDQILHHLGHVFLYLRDPHANNDCTEAAYENAVLCGWELKHFRARWRRAMARSSK